MIDTRLQKVVDEVAVKYAARFAKRTTSRLELDALRAFPSSPFQIAIRQEIERRNAQEH